MNRTTWRLHLRVVTVATVVLALWAVGGPTAWLYAGVFVAAVLPVRPLVLRLFGPGPWGMVATGVIGYACAALGLWLLRPLGPLALPVWCLGAVLAGTRRWATRPPLLRTPRLNGRARVVLTLLGIVTSLIVAIPYARVGETDVDGGRRYRAYFTADFVWHEALTTELMRRDRVPMNPFRASEPLSYYWGYFLLPASAGMTAEAATGRAAPIDMMLKANGLLAGLLVISTIFLTTWTFVPRSWAAGAATLLTLVAASAEGVFAAGRVWSNAASFWPLRDLNVDAVSYWWFGGLSMDGLPRTLWYNPQHSMACAVGLLAVVVGARGRQDTPVAAIALLAGSVSAAAFLLSPFPAAALCAVTVAVMLPRHRRDPARGLLVALALVTPVAAALAAIIAWGMVRGAGGALRFGPNDAAFHAPLITLGLAVGPLLMMVAGGGAVALYRALRGHRAAQVDGRLTWYGAVVSLGLFFFVTLELEPIWVGWRAGHVLQVVAPVAIATGLVGIGRRRRRLAAVVCALWLVVGAPTTIIDTYNAQDTSNLDDGPGFRWTLRVSAAEQEALDWVRDRTPPEAVVQAAAVVRGRDSWAYVPAFARRRMAAGLPISLLVTDHTRVAAAEAERIFQVEDGLRAWMLARDLGIDYLWIGPAEQAAYPDASERLLGEPRLFEVAFGNTEVLVLHVRCKESTLCM